MDAQKQEILEYLAYIASQRRTLKLITNFRGMPVDFTAGIIRCAQATWTVRLSVYHRLIVSLKAADTILIHSDLFPSILTGDIDHVDMRTAIITLRNLDYVSGSMGNRKNTRVQPESPINVEVISRHGYSLPGEMIDISLDGLSIHLDKDQIPDDEILSPHTPVKIRLGLPYSAPFSWLVSNKEDIHDISVQGKIAYTKESQQTYRIGLLTFLNKLDLERMRRYIFDRQTEILDEIKQKSSAC